MEKKVSIELTQNECMCVLASLVSAMDDCMRQIREYSTSPYDVNAVYIWLRKYEDLSSLHGYIAHKLGLTK